RVEAEGLARERAVREPPQEGVPEDRGVDGGDRPPELVGEGDGAPRASIVLRPRARPAPPRAAPLTAALGGDYARAAQATPRREGGVSPYELALHTWTLDTTPLADALRIAKRTGWKAVELRRIDFDRARNAGHPAERVLDLVQASGLGVAAVGVELGWMFAEGADRERLLAVFGESCRWAAALGCTTVMSPVDRGGGPLERAVASLGEVGDVAARHGVRLALEFNSQAQQFNTLARARAALARADHRGCGLL